MSETTEGRVKELADRMSKIKSLAIFSTDQRLDQDWLDFQKHSLRRLYDSVVESAGSASEVGEIAENAERAAREFATLLCDNPTLSTVPIQDWTVPRLRRMFDELDAAINSLMRVAGLTDVNAANGRE